MRRGHLGSSRDTEGPVRRGLTRLLRLSSRETQSGAGRRPRFAFYRQRREILQSRFRYCEKSPMRGTPRVPPLTNILFAYWTSGPQRRTDTRA